MTASPEQLSDVVSAVQIYEMPVVGSSYSAMFLVPKAQRKYCVSQTPMLVEIWRVWTAPQLLL